MTTDPFQILLVEDNPGDVDLTREALHESKVHTQMSVVHDGDEALAFLRHQGAHAAAPRPDLILLDLNLPKKDGRAVLGEIKEDPALASIPVVVLTSSEAERDIAHVYALHANCFVTKPIGLEQFLEIVRTIEQFWLTVVKLPRVT